MGPKVKKTIVKTEQKPAKSQESKALKAKKQIHKGQSGQRKRKVR